MNHPNLQKHFGRFMNKIVHVDYKPVIVNGMTMAATFNLQSGNEVLDDIREEARKHRFEDVKVWLPDTPKDDDRTSAYRLNVTLTQSYDSLFTISDFTIC